MPFVSDENYYLFQTLKLQEEIRTKDEEIKDLKKKNEILTKAQCAGPEEISKNVLRTHRPSDHAQDQSVNNIAIQASQTKYVNTAGSYLASNDKRLLVGLGDNSIVKTITIQWPNGQSNVYSDLKSKRYYQIIEGDGISEYHY